MAVCGQLWWVNWGGASLGFQLLSGTRAFPGLSPQRPCAVVGGGPVAALPVSHSIFWLPLKPVLGTVVAPVPAESHLCPWEAASPWLDRISGNRVSTVEEWTGDGGAQKEAARRKEDRLLLEVSWREMGRWGAAASHQGAARWQMRTQVRVFP